MNPSFAKLIACPLESKEGWGASNGDLERNEKNKIARTAFEPRQWQAVSLEARPLIVEDRRSPRLARHVHHVVVIREAVEARGRAARVGAHVLEVEPVADVERAAAETGALGDAVDAVARWAPERVRRGAAGPFVAGSVALVLLVVAAVVAADATGGLVEGQDLRHGVLVVEDDAGEVAVHAVVEIEHVVCLARVRVAHVTAGDHVAGERVRRRDEVATRFAEDTHGRRKVGVNSLAERGSHGLEQVARKATANIKVAKLVTDGGRLVENAARILHGFDEGRRIGGARANVEADAHHVEAKLAGEREQVRSAIERGAKFEAEAAERRGVIGEDAEVQLGVGEQGLDLVQLVGIVKGHLLDTLFGGVANVRAGLARLRVNDASRVNAQVEHLIDLGLRGAIEAGAERGEQAEDLRVGVALDGYTSSISHIA